MAGVSRGQELAKAAGWMGEGGASLAPAAEWARAVVETYPQPRLPLEQDWEVSTATLMGRVPNVPRVAVRLLRLLNRFAAIRLGVDEVGFDGERIAWSQVTEVRTHRLAEVFGGSLLEAEIERLSARLPPVPGRTWVVARIAELMLTLVHLSAGSPAVDAPEESGDDPRIAVEIIHNGHLRKEMRHQAGLCSALLLAAMPEANSALTSLAEERGIAVVPSQVKSAWQTAGERGEALRTRMAAIRSRFVQEASESAEPEATRPENA